MSMTAHKRGDTFDYSDQLAMTVDGVAVTDFTGMTGASQLRHAGGGLSTVAPGTLVADLVFTWLDAAQGLYRVNCATPTDTWPLGTLRHDVQLTLPSGDVVSTATELINVVEDVTHG